MNRRLFLKTLAALPLLGMSSRLLAAPRIVPISIAGLGKYINHEIAGDIRTTTLKKLEKTEDLYMRYWCGGIVSLEYEETKLDAVCYDDPKIADVKLQQPPPYINFPIENRLYVNYEHGQECFIMFNLRKAEYDKLQDPAHVYEVLKNCSLEYCSGKWKLAHITYTGDNNA